MSYLLILDFH